MSDDSGSRHPVPADQSTSEQDSGENTSAAQSVHAPQQPALPQRLPAPAGDSVPPPATPVPAVGRDPNPRVGSMHNLAPRPLAPPFPLKRKPIYFPRGLVQHPAKSQSACAPDTSSPPTDAAKGLKKGTPQKDWGELIRSNVEKKAQNEDARAASILDKLAKHQKNFDDRREKQEAATPTPKPAPVQRVRKRHFRGLPFSPIPEETNTRGVSKFSESPASRTLARGHPDSRPRFQKDITDEAYWRHRRVPRPERQSVLPSTTDPNRPGLTMSIDDPITRSPLFQPGPTPFAYHVQPVSTQDRGPIIRPETLQESQASSHRPPFQQNTAVPDDNGDIIMSDAPQIDPEAEPQFASSIFDVQMTEAPDVSADEQFVPNPSSEQSPQDPFASLWEYARANESSRQPDPEIQQAAAPVSQAVPPPHFSLDQAFGQQSWQQQIAGPQFSPVQPFELGQSWQQRVAAPPTPLFRSIGQPYQPIGASQVSPVPSLSPSRQQVAPFSTPARANHEGTVMFNAETPMLERKRRIDQVDDPEEAGQAGPEAIGEVIDISMEDVAQDDSEPMEQDQAPQKPLEANPAATPTSSFYGDGLMPGTFPVTPTKAEARDGDVPMQNTGADTLVQSLNTWQQVSQHLSSVCTAATRQVCKVYRSVKRRAVEACQSRAPAPAPVAAQRGRRRSSPTRYLRQLSPEARHREKSRRARTGRITPSSRKASRKTRPDEEMRDAQVEVSEARPDEQMQDAVAPTSNKTAAHTSLPLAKPRSELPVAKPSGRDPADEAERQRKRDELMRRWLMPAEEYFREERERTGIDFDKEAPPIPARRPATPPPAPAPEPEEPADAAPCAPSDIPETEQLPEELYDGYMNGPEQAEKPRQVEWLAATPPPEPTTTTTLTSGENIETSEAERQGAVDKGVVREERETCQSLPFPQPLPARWESKVETAMARPESRQVATTLRGDPITRRDLATCCVPMAWLNDEIINAYLGHIVNHARCMADNAARHDQPKYHAFNSFFFSNLRDKGYESVRRWASRAKIGGAALLQADTVFVPIHDHMHWTLMVVKPTARTIEHFDSLGHPSRAHAARVKVWLRGELGDLFKEEEWRVLPSASPQQNNGSDCGVFLLTTAKLVAFQQPLKYGAKDIPEIRKRIAAELLNGGFDGDFDPREEFPTKSML